MDKISDKKRFLALSILKDLLRCLKSLHADIFYVALAESGFSDDERTRLVGSSFRIAASKNWMFKTCACLPSRRNHSNLQSVWISHLFSAFSKSGPKAQKKIADAYAYWSSNKLSPPDDLANKWQEVSGCHVAHIIAPKVTRDGKIGKSGET